MRMTLLGELKDSQNSEYYLFRLGAKEPTSFVVVILSSTPFFSARREHSFN